MKKDKQQKEKAKAKKLKYRMKKKDIAPVSSYGYENESMKDYVPLSQVLAGLSSQNPTEPEERRKWMDKNAAERADLISEFLEHENIGKVDSIIHDPGMQNPHIDLLIVESAGNPESKMLVTSGMSSRTMTTPPGLQHFNLAELIYCLPEGWTIEKHSNDEHYSWHVKNLLQLASLPLRRSTWFGQGHTIDQKTLRDLDDSICPFTGYGLDIPSLPEHLPLLTANGNSLETVRFLQAIPLYAEEIQILRNIAGPRQKNDLFWKHGLHKPVDIARKNFARESNK